MSAHTPGPWEASDEGGEAEVVEAVTSGPKKYVRAEICHAFVDEDEREVSLANLRLIAAAPDLAEALKAALKMLDQPPPPPCDGEPSVAELKWSQGMESAGTLARAALKKAGLK